MELSQAKKINRLLRARKPFIKIVREPVHNRKLKEPSQYSMITINLRSFQNLAKPKNCCIQMFTSLAVQETIADTNVALPKQGNVLESLKQKHNILILTHQCFLVV